jgi:DNA-binding transcriptional regulator YdaS (Cro superfamily)
MRIDIKLAMVRCGTPQYQVAQAIGVSENALSKYIRGHGKLPPELDRSGASHSSVATAGLSPGASSAVARAACGAPRHSHIEV